MKDSARDIFWSLFFVFLGCTAIRIVIATILDALGMLPSW